MIEKDIKTLNKNCKLRYLQDYPDLCNNRKYNGLAALEESLATKRLQKYTIREIRRTAKNAVKLYYISQNHHTGDWGLDTIKTPEGGGVIAQGKTFTECVKRAYDVYGIHPLFIIGVNQIDGFRY